MNSKDTHRICNLKEIDLIYNNAIFEASKIYKDDSIGSQEKYNQLSKLAYVYNSVNDPTYKKIGYQLQILSARAYNEWQDEVKKQNAKFTKEENEAILEKYKKLKKAGKTKDEAMLEIYKRLKTAGKI